MFDFAVLDATVVFYNNYQIVITDWFRQIPQSRRNQFIHRFLRRRGFHSQEYMQRVVG